LPADAPGDIAVAADFLLPLVIDPPGLGACLARAYSQQNTHQPNAIGTGWRAGLWRRSVRVAENGWASAGRTSDPPTRVVNDTSEDVTLTNRMPCRRLHDGRGPAIRPHSMDNSWSALWHARCILMVFRQIMEAQVQP